MNTIPDHVGREAVRLLIEAAGQEEWYWPEHKNTSSVKAIAKLLMNPPAPMTDPDEEAAKRVLRRVLPLTGYNAEQLAAATEQMRKEREAWDAGR